DGGGGDERGPEVALPAQRLGQRGRPDGRDAEVARNRGVRLGAGEGVTSPRVFGSPQYTKRPRSATSGGAALLGLSGADQRWVRRIRPTRPLKSVPGGLVASVS